MTVVRELNVYPVKSAGGTALTSAELTPAGFRYDREFMLIRPDNRHLSQREVPRMALLRPSYDGTKLVVGDLTHEATDDGPVLDVTVHRKPCQGIDQGDRAAAWFSGFLATECRLVRFTGVRPTSRGGGVVEYADGYPIMLISAESLTDLNQRLDDPLPMNRFRPSIVLEGLGAYGEDDVHRLRVGDAELEIVKPCDRCVITTTDQQTAEKTREPLRTLARYRTRVFDGERGIMFGQNAIPRTLGRISVGDSVTIL